MNRIRLERLIVVVIFLQVIGLGGCSEDNDTLPSAFETKTVVMEGRISQSLQSKLTYVPSGEKVDVCWQAEADKDAFSLHWMGGGTRTYMFKKQQTEANQTTAEFTFTGIVPTIKEGTKIHAVYPAAERGSKSGTLSFDFSKQEGTESNLMKYHVMEAETTMEESLSGMVLDFQHKVAVLKLTLSHEDFKGKVLSDIQLKADGLRSSAFYLLEAFEPWEEGEGNTGTVNITSSFTGDASTGDVSIYVSMVPGVLENLVVTMCCGDRYYKATLETVTFAAGSLYQVRLNDLKLTHVLEKGSSGRKTGYVVYDALGLQAWADAIRKELTYALNLTLAADIVMPEELTLDLDADGLNDSNWKPIGSDLADSYGGIIDGGGHAIKGLVVKQAKDYVGFIGYLVGTVKNLTLLESSVAGDNYVGAIVGYNERGSVINCHHSGEVTGSGGYVGGLVGQNFAAVLSYSSNAGVVKSVGDFTGGIVGQNVQTPLSGCYNTAKVTSTGSMVGGVTGQNSNAVMRACYNTGAVEGAGLLGGVAGGNAGTVSACYWSGTVQDNGVGTQVTGTMTWENVKEMMNETLGEFDYKYVVNDKGDASVCPLVLQLK